MKTALAADHEFVPASHENPLAPGVWKKVLFQMADFQPGVVPMVNWARLPPHSSFAPHYHEDMQEVFIILQGEVEMTVAGQSGAAGSSGKAKGTGTLCAEHPPGCCAANGASPLPENPALPVVEQSVVLRRGDAVLIEPREVHRMRNLGGEEVEYVVFGVARGQGGRTVVVE